MCTAQWQEQGHHHAPAAAVMRPLLLPTFCAMCTAARLRYTATRLMSTSAWSARLRPCGKARGQAGCKMALARQRMHVIRLSGQLTFHGVAGCNPIDLGAFPQAAQAPQHTCTSSTTAAARS